MLSYHVSISCITYIIFSSHKSMLLIWTVNRFSTRFKTKQPAQLNTSYPNPSNKAGKTLVEASKPWKSGTGIYELTVLKHPHCRCELFTSTEKNKTMGKKIQFTYKKPPPTQNNFRKFLNTIIPNHLLKVIKVILKLKLFQPLQTIRNTNDPNKFILPDPSQHPHFLNTA